MGRPAHHVKSYQDAAISGASAVNRPGFQQLLRDAKARKFQIVIVHAIDRLGRRLADLADPHDELTFLGIKLYTPDLGEVTQLHIAILGMMAQQQLRDIGSKTKNGQRGRAEAGMVAGGKAYGYEVLPPIINGKTIERGRRAVLEHEKLIIVRIFTEYANGRSPEDIARDLNEERIPGPGGGLWLNTTIRGQPDRGTGILNNAAYAGRIEWNRCSYVKNLKEGKRLPRPNPPEEWVVTEAEHLRIVDDVLWLRVKTRQQESRVRQAVALAETGNRLKGAHRPKYLLSEKLVCGCCGHPYTINKGTKGKAYSCPRPRNAGTCDNTLAIDRADIEGRALAGLKQKLMTEERVMAFRAAAEAEVAAFNKERGKEAGGQRRELKKLEVEIERAIGFILQGRSSPAMEAKLAELEARKAALEAALDVAAPALPMIDLPADWLESYRRQCDRLEEALADPSVRDEAMTAIRDLIENIVLTPTSDGSALKVELYGAMTELLAFSEAAANENPRDGDARGLGLSVVAGIGFEPMTFRL